MKNKGISLIVLVITIIVMIIIAATIIISISNSNIIENANKAKFLTRMKQYQQEYQINSIEYISNKNIINADSSGTGNGNIKTWIPSLQPEDEDKIIISGNIFILSTDNLSPQEKMWAVENNITVGGSVINDWDGFFASKNVVADKPASQTSERTNNYVGYDMYGNPVNLDLWNFYLINEAEFADYSEAELAEYAQLIGSYRLNTNNFEGGYIDPEKPSSEVTQIIGEIPAVIYNTGEENYSEVKSIRATFLGCVSLTKVPAIPNTIIEVSDTFMDCANLTTAPTIPNGVIFIWGAFAGCSSLTTAPTIPNSVTNMDWTFSNCSSLTTAPTIPSTVKSMVETFNNCTELTGSLIINAASILNYENCLLEASTSSGTNLVLSGDSPQILDIFNTRSTNSNITTTVQNVE